MFPGLAAPGREALGVELVGDRLVRLVLGSQGNDPVREEPVEPLGRLGVVSRRRLACVQGEVAVLGQGCASMHAPSPSRRAIAYP